MRPSTRAISVRYLESGYGWLIAAPFWLVVVIGLLYSITTIGNSPVYSTALTELIPHHALGTAYALRSVMGFGAGVISPIVFGFVLEGRG